MTVTPPSDGPSGSAPRIVLRAVVPLLLDRTARWAKALNTDRIGASAFDAALGSSLAHLPYGATDGPGQFGLDVADSLRRPVSVHAVAGSMMVAYETVRGRFARLAGMGMVRRDRRGIIVPDATLRRPDLLAVQVMDRTAFAQTVGGLRAIGYPVPAGLDAMIHALAAPIVGRLLLDCAIRSFERLVTMHGDYVAATVFGGLIDANTRHLATDPALSGRYADHDTPPPDALRRPVGLRQLARDIDLPYETVRRRIATMIDVGEVVPVDGGLIIPARVLTEERFRINNIIFVQHFTRLLRDAARVAGSGST